MIASVHKIDKIIKNLDGIIELKEFNNEEKRVVLYCLEDKQEIIIQGVDIPPTDSLKIIRDLMSKNEKKINLAIIEDNPVIDQKSIENTFETGEA